MTDCSWEVPSSDNEDDASYRPSPEKIVNLYNLIQKGVVLDLECVVHPRKEPTVIKSDEPVTDKDSQISESQSEVKNSPNSPSEPNEFDFDSQAVDPVKRFSPRRAPNRLQTKKVARMDKVCSNIIKYQKLDAAQAQQDVEKKDKPS